VKQQEAFLEAYCNEDLTVDKFLLVDVAEPAEETRGGPERR